MGEARHAATGCNASDSFLKCRFYAGGIALSRLVQVLVKRLLNRGNNPFFNQERREVRSAGQTPPFSANLLESDGTASGLEVFDELLIAKMAGSLEL
jgi:hypothetical protein